MHRVTKYALLQPQVSTRISITKPHHNIPTILTRASCINVADFIAHDINGDSLQETTKLQIMCHDTSKKQNGIIIGILILAMVLLSWPAFAQRKTTPFITEMGIYSSVSGNNFGVGTIPCMGIRIVKRVHLVAGPIMQLRSGNIYGVHSELRFVGLTYSESESGKNTLYFNFGYDRYLDAPLSGSAVALSIWLNEEAGKTTPPDYGSMRYRGWQGIAGFGATHEFVEHLALSAGAGIAYHRIDAAADGEQLQLERSKGFTLNLRVGFSWKFGASTARL